jgi:hypothetical protein
MKLYWPRSERSPFSSNFTEKIVSQAHIAREAKSSGRNSIVAI